MLPVCRRDLTAQGAVRRGVSSSLRSWSRSAWSSVLVAQRATPSTAASSLRSPSTPAFDSRDAELVVGTSAGSFTATALRAGLSSIDAEARHLGRTQRRGHRIVERIVTPYTEPEVERSLLPSAPRMTST